MKRHLAAAVIVAGVIVGLVDPYACRQYSLNAAPTGESARLRIVARKALALLPVPRGYVLDGKSGHVEAGLAERVYEPRVGGDNSPPTLEQRVFVNSEVKLPSGLATEGGAPRRFPMQGAAAVEVTTAGMEDPSATPGDGGRVAMPVTPEQSAMALTIIRVLLADPETERVYRSGDPDGVLTGQLDRAAKHPSEVQSLVIELYGGRRDVEAVARRLPVAAIRRLLDSR